MVGAEGRGSSCLRGGASRWDTTGPAPVARRWGRFDGTSCERLFPWLGSSPGSRNAWVPPRHCCWVRARLCRSSFLCCLPLGLRPWAYAPQGKGRATSTPSPAPTPAVAAGTFTRRTVVRALAVGCWVPNPAVTNARSMSPNTFCFQQQHLGAARGWCQLCGVQGASVSLQETLLVAPLGPNCAACPSRRLPCRLTPPPRYPLLIQLCPSPPQEAGQDPPDIGTAAPFCTGSLAAAGPGPGGLSPGPALAWTRTPRAKPQAELPPAPCPGLEGTWGHWRLPTDSTSCLPIAQWGPVPSWAQHPCIPAGTCCP